ncbi:hypothetical protein VTN00DRAFT_6051 [Thermoascus crustaceus]|uniref:uncharacterized protein n=1 Tax=Thermoascus crustaceus TaxID=5088 RepID=UPI003742FC9E
MSLVTHNSERFMYSEAKDLTKTENSTAMFWRAILNREFPADRQLYTFQEWPPFNKRGNCRVYCFKDRTKRTFLYVEFKRADSTSAKLQEGYHQVTEYCKRYLRRTGHVQIDCMLCYGTHAAHWHLSRNADFYFMSTMRPVIDFIDADAPRAVELTRRFRFLRKTYGK